MTREPTKEEGVREGTETRSDVREALERCANYIEKWVPTSIEGTLPMDGDEVLDYARAARLSQYPREEWRKGVEAAVAERCALLCDDLKCRWQKSAKHIQATGTDRSTFNTMMAAIEGLEAVAAAIRALSPPEDKT